MVVGDDTNITKGGPTSTRGFLRRALTQRGSGISPDVLVAHDVDDELTTAPLSQSAAQNVVRNSFIAGSLSGMASILILYPMDFIRTNLQTAGIPNAAAAAATTTSAPKGAGGSVSSSLAVSTATGRTTAVASVPGPWHILRQTFQTGGIRALYTGITLPLMAQAVFKGTVFSVNNILEQAILDFRSSYYHQRDGIETKLTAADRLFCGFVAGMVNGGIFVTPVEYVRNQLIADQARRSQIASANAGGVGSTSTSWGVIQQAIQVHGFHKLWRGMGITMLRDGCGVASFFMTLGVTQHWLMHLYYPDGDASGLTPVHPPLLIRIISGGMGGFAYWIGALPLDTVKTWVQSADPSVRISPTKIIRELYNQVGVVGVLGRLHRGWPVAYARGIPSSAITVGVYSYCYRQLDHYFPAIE